MLLPRPARLLRQCPHLFHVHHTRHIAAQAVRQSLPVEVDESYHPYMDDMSMGSRQRQGPIRDTGKLYDGNDRLSYDTSAISSFGSRSPHDYDASLDDEETGREERRSPATLLGSKRVGLVVLPHQLTEAIQQEINVSDPHEIRRSFLQLNPTTRLPSKSRDAERFRATSSAALAKAAAFLPSEFAAVRNVLTEMRRRVGDDWLPEGPVVEITSTVGAGLWALADAQDLLEPVVLGQGRNLERKYEFCHTGRSGMELAERLAQSMPTGALDLTFQRQPQKGSSEKPALSMSTFHLSTLPTVSAQMSHLRHLLSLDSSYLVIVERNTATGWQAISSAREYILSQSTADAPLHIVAPCPHESTCPMLGGRDSCSFSQRLQRPSFVRRTKHAKKGEEDMGYSYLVFARGARPTAEADFADAGRRGGVAKEETRREREKLEGKNVLREVEGGGFEMVSLAEEGSEEGGTADAAPGHVDTESLRKEAYDWPRLVAPPIKRSGHVIMDTCHSSGQLHRITFAKSHSKQAYYDARKSSWGDLFPHTPKGKEVVRDRGVRRLMPAVTDLGETEAGPSGSHVWPTAELEEGDVEGGVGGIRASGPTETNSSSWVFQSEEAGLKRRGPSRERRSRRGLHTSAVQRSAHPPPPTTEPELPPPRAKVTIAELYRLRAASNPITCLTAYDYPTALLSQNAGVDMVLIGDSLSQVALGHTSTNQITLDEMIHHATAVTRGAKTPFVFADLPFGSFEESVEQGVRSTIEMVKRAGVDGVKIEGGREIVPLVKRLSDMGIAVMPHIGLQPQRATSLSGYLVQGRSAEGAYELFETASLLKQAGAFAFLLEAIPHSLARHITDALEILTIGIGAGPGTSGQVLVITDVLGTYATSPGAWKAKFVRHFGNVGEVAKEAVEGYVKEVKGGGFPEVGKESYTMKKEEWARFLEMRQTKS